MIGYKKIQKLLKKEKAKGKSLRVLASETDIDYGTLWRLLQASSNKDRFKTGKGREGKIIMNITADTLDKLCCFFKKNPGDLLDYR